MAEIKESGALTLATQPTQTPTPQVESFAFDIYLATLHGSHIGFTYENCSHDSLITNAIVNTKPLIIRWQVCDWCQRQGAMLPDCQEGLSCRFCTLMMIWNHKKQGLSGYQLSLLLSSNSVAVMPKGIVIRVLDSHKQSLSSQSPSLQI